MRWGYVNVDSVSALSGSDKGPKPSPDRGKACVHVEKVKGISQSFLVPLSLRIFLQA